MKRISFISIPYLLLLTLCILFTNYIGQAALVLSMIVYILIISSNKIIVDNTTVYTILLSILIMILAFIEMLIGNWGLQGFIRLVQLFTITLIIYSAECITEYEKYNILKLLDTISIIYMLIFVLYALYEKKLMRFEAFFSNPNKLGQFVLNLLVINLIVPDKKRKTRIVSIVIILFLIIISSSRSAILATITMFFSLFVLMSKNENKILKKLKGTGLFWLIITIIAVFTMVYPSLYGTDFGSKLTVFSRVYTHKNFFSQRQIIWSYMLAAIKEKPFFGYGLGVLPVTFTFDLRSAHSFYLQFSMQMGIIGLTLFVLFLYQIYKRLLNRSDYISVVVRSFMLGMLVHECFEVSITENNWPCGFFMWLVIALALGNTGATEDNILDG